MLTTRTRARRANRPADRSADEGSLLMALLFTMMISALSIAIMVSVMTGLKKAENSRSFALAQQAADIALADALMHANMRLLTTSPATNSGVTGSGPATVNWSWTATQTSGTSATSRATWIVDVEARGKNVDRHFRSTLARTPVVQATWSDTNGDNIRDHIRYTANNNRYFGTGFYAVQDLLLNDYGGRSPIVDGYNGGRGLIGSSQNITAQSAEFDTANLWNWKASDNIATRCSGLHCITENIRKYEQDFQTSPFKQCTGPNQAVNWVASSGTPLQNEDCYASLTFDVDYYFAPATPDEQAWISVNSDVIINPGVQVGANRTRVYTKPSSWVLSIEGGEFNLPQGSTFSGGVYNPRGYCGMDGTNASGTLWIGAAVCSTLEAGGASRLRYDGAMANVERPDPTTAATVPGVWNLRDFQIID
jgi:Tfp pilus assembly protein PilX